jgi:ribonuclease HI
MERIELWSDGGANFPFSASYGFIIVHFKNEQIINKIEGNGILLEPPFSSPHAELEGCIEGLRAIEQYFILLDKELPIDYYCDAEFVTKSLTVWGDSRGMDIKKWNKKEYGFVLFTLYQWIQHYRITNILKIHHVKAHSGLIYNERADELATLARKK